MTNSEGGKKRSILHIGENGKRKENDKPLRQRRYVARLLNSEPAGPIRALQVLEPVDGDARRPRRELQQPRLPLGGPAAHDLPEPLDHLVVDLVAAVVREFVPVVPGRR